LYPNFPVPRRRYGERGEPGEVKIGGISMKYVIVEDGGKQFKAVEGGTIEVDHYEAEVGDPIGLERVLMVVDGETVTVGTPIVSGVKVEATVVAQIKGPKVVSFKYTPKKRFRQKKGHRQQYTRVRIDSIITE
jgi:large subunit ribosomal protein L21